MTNYTQQEIDKFFANTTTFPTNVEVEVIKDCHLYTLKNGKEGMQFPTTNLAIEFMKKAVANSEMGTFHYNYAANELTAYTFYNN